MPQPAKMTSGRLLAGNAVWNLVGTCLPVLVAVVCLPVLKHTLGTDRLGIISLAWVVVGYFGFFDFGLSRALTKLIAEKIGSKELSEIPRLTWTSLFLMGCLGAIGAVGTLLVSPLIVKTLVKVPPSLQTEALHTFYWLSASLPFVVITAGLRGFLEALQQFRIATAIRIPMGIFTYVAPVAVLPFSHSLVPIVAVLTIGRIIACVAHLWACFRCWPALRHECRFEAKCAGPLMRFGGWMTVSNIVAPLITNFDRFLIGATVSLSAVAYYALPVEVLTRILLLPAALMGVLFPAFSTAHAADRSRLMMLFESGIRTLFVVTFPVILLIVAFAPVGLRLWLGADFAQNSTAVVRFFAVAVFINCIEQIPFAYLQSVGRPDITAKFHLFQLPPYWAVLFLLVKFYGIQGAAMAWLLRTAVETIVFFLIASRSLPSYTFIRTKLPIMLAAALMAFSLAALDMSLKARILFVTPVCAASLLAAWHWLLSPRERLLLQLQLRGSNGGD